MEQLLKQDPVAMGMLGKQIIREEEYRPLTYVLTAEETDKKIYYNLLTHEMIALSFNELESSETRKYFIENWYLVPKEHDDQQLVDECRAVLTLMDSWPKNIHNFYIFTTLDCNARCFYCYENRMPASNMTISTASRVVEYMQEHAGEDSLKIAWFGGEPLFNYPIIDFITDRLKEKGIQFESIMFSNGLLFDDTLVAKARDHWNIKKVQITLDGTRQVYKRVKAYVNDVQDPFGRVLQNIDSLLKNEIKVNIRLNIGPHNYEDIQNLVDFLCEHYKEERGLNVYVSPLFEIKNYSNEKKEFIYHHLDNLNSKLNHLFGQRNKKEFSETISNNSCMASGREAVTILPDGKVGICPTIPNESILGNIFTEEFDEEERERFGKRFYREDICRPCPMYPNCYIVNGCPNRDTRNGCDTVRLNKQINEIKEKMKNRYRQNLYEDEARSVQQK